MRLHGIKHYALLPIEGGALIMYFALYSPYDYSEFPDCLKIDSYYITSNKVYFENLQLLQSLKAKGLDAKRYRRTDIKQLLDKYRLADYGMKNIIENMRTEDIFRVRVGIGRPQNDRMELKDYVLGKINDGQRTLLEPALENAAQALKMFVSGADADAVMRTFNKREKKTPVSQTDAEQTE